MTLKEAEKRIGLKADNQKEILNFLNTYSDLNRIEHFFTFDITENYYKDGTIRTHVRSDVYIVDGQTLYNTERRSGLFTINLNQPNGKFLPPAKDLINEFDLPNYLFEKVITKNNE